MVVFKYELQSGNGELETLRYINQYKISIYTDPDDGEEVEFVGEALASHVLFESMLRLNRTRAMESIIDTVPQHLYDVLDAVFNFDMHRIRDRFSQLSPTSNVFVIERMAITQKFRGQNIGRNLVTDIAVRFGFGSALIALMCFPLQFESSFIEAEKIDPFQIKSLGTEIDKSTNKLLRYYKSLGFSLIPQSNNILTLEPYLRNADITRGLDEMQMV